MSIQQTRPTSQREVLQRIEPIDFGDLRAAVSDARIDPSWGDTVYWCMRHAAPRERERARAYALESCAHVPVGRMTLADILVFCLDGRAALLAMLHARQQELIHGLEPFFDAHHVDDFMCGFVWLMGRTHGRLDSVEGRGVNWFNWMCASPKGTEHWFAVGVEHGQRVRCISGDYDVPEDEDVLFRNCLDHDGERWAGLPEHLL